MKGISLLYLALCGLVLGISTYFQPSTQYLPLFLGFALFVYWFRRIPFWKNIVHCVVAVLVITTTMATVMLPWVVISYGLTGTVSARAMRPAPWQGIWEGFGEGEDYHIIRKEVMREMGYSIDNIPTFSPDYYIILEKTVARLENPPKAIMDDGITYELIKREYGDHIVYGTPEYQDILKDKVIDAVKKYPLWVAGHMAKRIPKAFVYISEIGLEYYPRKADGGIDWGKHQPISLSLFGQIKDNPVITIYTLGVGALKAFFAVIPVLFMLIVFYKLRCDWRKWFLVAIIPCYFAAIHIPTFTSSFKSILPGCVGYIVFTGVILHELYIRRNRRSNNS